MYLNQIVTLQSCIDSLSNAYGEIMYSPAEQIKARKQYKVQEVTDKNGNIHKSTYEVYTKRKVNVDDLIDGKLVLLSESYVGLAGNTVLYRSLTV